MIRSLLGRFLEWLLMGNIRRPDGTYRSRYERALGKEPDLGPPPVWFAPKYPLPPNEVVYVPASTRPLGWRKELETVNGMRFVYYGTGGKP